MKRAKNKALIKLGITLIQVAMGIYTYNHFVFLNLVLYAIATVVAETLKTKISNI